MATTTPNDATLVQEVLINNLEALGFRSITAETIGNRQGKPDGIVGDGTSTALHVLALMAQIEAGVEPAEMNTGYNADSAPLIIAYVEKYAGAEAAAQFEEGIDSFYPGGEFNQDYDEATLHLDNAARELNVAEFRRLGEGAVEMVEGTPPAAPKTEAQLRAQVAAMQEVIFTGDILAHLGMERTQIGNYATGEADGILGKGSSEAFQRLAILSERAAGRDGEEITGRYDAELVKSYLEANGVTAEDAQKFVDNAAELNTTLYDRYVATTVDPATVRLPDTDMVASTELETGGERTVKMNYAQASFLGQVSASEAGTAEDLLMSIAYGEAAQQRATQIGLTSLQAEMNEKQAAYIALLQTDTSGLSVDALEAHNASAAEAKAELDGLTADVDALKVTLEQAEIDVVVPEGVTDEKLTTIMASIESLASDSTQIAAVDVTVEEDARLTGSATGLSDPIMLGPVPFSDELEGLPQELMPYTFGPSPTELYGPFIAAGDTNAIVSLEVKSGDDPTAPLTFERFEDISDKKIQTNDEKALVANYPAVYEAELQARGMDQARERLAQADAARDTVRDRWNTAKDTYDDVRDQIEAFEDRFKAEVEVGFTATMDGQEGQYSYTRDQIEKLDRDSWYDTREENAFFDAGRAAYDEAINANPEYQALIAQRDELKAQLYGPVTEWHGNYETTTNTRQGGEIYKGTNEEYQSALAAVNQIETDVKTAELAVSVVPADASQTDPSLVAEADRDRTLQTAGMGS